MAIKNQALRDVIESMQVDVPESSIDQLAGFAASLWDYNARINLTRHTDYQSFVARDIVDSLQLSRWLQAGEQVLDIGSGGGVPGITLAILRPDLSLTLCDSVGKKARALQAMVEELQLPVEVYAQRAEQILDDFSYDACTARAVGPLWKICRWLENRWLPAGRLLAVKGPNWTGERLEAREKGFLKKVNLRCVAQYQTPVVNSKNVILKLWAKGAPEK